jgi:hypothetical protein
MEEAGVDMVETSFTEDVGLSQRVPRFSRLEIVYQ